MVVGGELRLSAGAAVRDGSLLSPTTEGWARYLQLAPASGEPWKALRDAGELWWGRKIPRDLLKAAPEVDDETAFERLQRMLGEARDAHEVSPREFVEWLDANDFGKASELLEGYLDSPTKSLEEFSDELRKRIDAELDGRWYSGPALRSGQLSLLDDQILKDDAGRSYILVRRSGQETRRVYVDRPKVSGAPYTIAEGDVQEGDMAWNVDPGDADDIEDVWARYAKLIRALELVPALLGEAHDLLQVAAEAITSPKCLGDQRQRAIRALRTAEKYYRRAANRIHAGRPAAVLDALVQMVRHITRSAVAVAEACGVGQLEFLGGGPVVIRERDRDALVAAGEDIVDPADTAAGQAEVETEPEVSTEEPGEPEGAREAAE